MQEFPTKVRNATFLIIGSDLRKCLSIVLVMMQCIMHTFVHVILTAFVCVPVTTEKSDTIRDLCVLLAHHCMNSFGPSWFENDSKFFLLLCLKMGFEIRGMIVGKETKEDDWKPSDRIEKVFPFYIRAIESILLQLVSMFIGFACSYASIIMIMMVIVLVFNTLCSSLLICLWE
jgi:hypothetical protein